MIRSNLDIVAIIVGTLCTSLVFLWVVQRTLRRQRQSLQNDVIGSTLNVIGTTYAVLITFMLSGVWLNLRTAESNTEQEANDVVDLFRVASALPDPAGPDVRTLSLRYVRVVLTQEWPAMARQQDATAGHPVMDGLWTSLAECRPQTPSEQIGLDHALYTLSSLSEHRRLRELENHTSLPTLLWSVLISGAAVTIACACLFGVQDFRIHLLQVFFLTFLISMVLVAISDLDTAFSGPVHVSPQAFESALRNMESK